MSNMNPCFLGVNVDHVATLRQARGTHFPCPVKAALIAEQNGADGITVHLREDRRHIQLEDIEKIKQSMTTRLNFEMALTDEMMLIAKRIKPHFVCLVPEKRQELTTEGGLDVISIKEQLKRSIAELKQKDILVSLFVDSNIEQIAAAHEVGADFIEIHTGCYAHATDFASQKKYLAQLKAAVKASVEFKLRVNAGHGLNYDNVKPVAEINEIYELNIGHAIVSHALYVGFAQAVSQMKALILAARKR